MGNSTNRILWGALVASLLIYLVVAFVAAPEGNPDFPVGIMAMTLAALSVATAVGTFVYRKSALAGPIQRGEIDPSSQEGMAKAFPPFIVCLVLSESVGIYGLVLAFLAGEGAYAVPFVLAGVALLYLHRPTAPDLHVPDRQGRPAPIA